MSDAKEKMQKIMDGVLGRSDSAEDGILYIITEKNAYDPKVYLGSNRIEGIKQVTIRFDAATGVPTIQIVGDNTTDSYKKLLEKYYFTSGYGKFEVVINKGEKMWAQLELLDETISKMNQYSSWATAVPGSWGHPHIGSFGFGQTYVSYLTGT